MTCPNVPITPAKGFDTCPIIPDLRYMAPNHLICTFAATAGLLASSIISHAALVLNPPITIDRVLTVNPIIVSDNTGASTATFMGNASQEASIKALVDAIWAQAGIDVNWGAPKALNSTETLNGSEGPNGNNPRPTTDLSGDAGGIDHATIGSALLVTNNINMFFVDIPAGFSSLSANSSAGLAETPGNIISMYVGSNLLSFAGGQEVIAGVIAHEIGHNLSLPHLTETENLMQPGGSPDPGERLNASQINAARTSGFNRGLLVMVPEPSSTWFMAVSLTLLAIRRKR